MYQQKKIFSIFSHCNQCDFSWLWNHDLYGIYLNLHKVSSQCDYIYKYVKRHFLDEIWYFLKKQKQKTEIIVISSNTPKLAKYSQRTHPSSLEL